MTNPNDPASQTTPVSHGYNPDTPGSGTGAGTGLTKREVFAMHAMQGLCANTKFYDCPAETLAEYSIQQADALIAALNEGGEK